MPREATGELRKLASGWEATIRVEGKHRVYLFLPTCKTEPEARERCTALAKLAVRLRHAGHVAKAPELLEMGARARAGRPWEAVVAAVDALCAGGVEEARATTVPTFAEFARQWTSGELHARHRDHVPAKDSARDAELLRIYVNEHIGEKRLDEITLDDAELVMASMPEERSKATRRHVAQVVRRTLALAVYPARLIAASPIPRGWLPKLGKPKARAYLYPDEDRKLLACKDIPLHRRLLWGFLAREGTRGPSEALSFRWRHVDLARGAVRLDENKTDDRRTWALNPGVARALTAWRKLVAPEHAGDDGRIFVDESGHVLNEDRLAVIFRADLRRAGIDRPELFEASAARMPIRAHDLRATFITIALANGKSETWVTDRTGHTTSGQLMNYRRAARTVTELALGELAPLDEAIPDLADCRMIAGCTGRDSNPQALRRRNLKPGTDICKVPDASDSDEIANPRRPELDRDAEPLRQSTGNHEGAADAVESALAAALERAARAGEWSTVATLARELEARRMARAGGNVVALDEARKRRG